MRYGGVCSGIEAAPASPAPAKPIPLNPCKSIIATRKIWTRFGRFLQIIPPKSPYVTRNSPLLVEKHYLCAQCSTKEVFWVNHRDKSRRRPQNNLPRSTLNAQRSTSSWRLTCFKQ